MKMSTHQHTHVKRMISLYKVHRVRAHTHAHTLTHQYCTENHSGWAMERRMCLWSWQMVHGEVGMSLYAQKSVNLPTRRPLFPLARVCHLRLSRRSQQFQHWWTRGQRSGEGSEVMVMSSLDVLWSADYWSAPPSGLYWCSHRRDCCRRHGNRAARK